MYKIDYIKCIYGDKCTQMHALMHHECAGSRFSHAMILHVEDGHFESCLKTIGAWGQKLWTKPFSFGGGFEPSHYIVSHQHVSQHFTNW